jgi:hypothetical protein
MNIHLRCMVARRRDPSTVVQRATGNGQHRGNGQAAVVTNPPTINISGHGGYPRGRAFESGFRTMTKGGSGRNNGDIENNGDARPRDDEEP